uniref:coiled-coil domain-containing protein 127-like isoform X2 n=1 Tax=Pristiophorus japonicus TaxID=55135 RepID=UPI00398F42EA
MNNLNVPMQNISPNEREGRGDGNKCYYALLVPMLALAACRWIWSRNSHKEIEHVTAVCKYEIETTKKELKLKHQGVIEKLKTEVQSCHSILSGQNQQLVEARKQFKQGQINSEKAEWQSQAKALMNEFETSLCDRQELYCSRFKPHHARLELERKMLSQAVTNPIAKELSIEADLKYIFKEEEHCANWNNIDKRKNEQWRETSGNYVSMG